jgi:hypothetical protein
MNAAIPELVVSEEELCCRRNDAELQACISVSISSLTGRR